MLDKVACLILTEAVKVVPIVVANDGTALKPSIQFDSRQHVNVGLMETVTHEFIAANPNPDPDILRERVVCESNVTYAISLDNSVSMPVAVSYKAKVGKTGASMKEQFLCEISIIQTCLTCVKRIPPMRHILPEDRATTCNSKCDECIEGKTICNDCAAVGQQSHLPALCACTYCLQKGEQCFKSDVVLVSECEQGNKSAFEAIIADRVSQVLPSEIMVCVLPDAVHVGKSVKASFANWPLLLDDQRASLTVIQTLQDEDPVLKKILKRDAVVNKDRMDYECVLQLSKLDVLACLSEATTIIHIIMPDRHKVNDTNSPVMYPHPIALCMGKEGKVLALDVNPTNKATQLIEIRLHIPADISVVSRNFADARSLAFLGGITTFICQYNKSISVVPPDAGKMKMNMKKADLQEILQSKGLPTVGKVNELKQQLSDSLLRAQESV